MGRWNDEVTASHVKAVDAVGAPCGQPGMQRRGQTAAQRGGTGEQHRHADDAGVPAAEPERSPEGPLDRDHVRCGLLRGRVNGRRDSLVVSGQAQRERRVGEYERPAPGGRGGDEGRDLVDVSDVQPPDGELDDGLGLRAEHGGELVAALRWSREQDPAGGRARDGRRRFRVLRTRRIPGYRPSARRVAASGRRARGRRRSAARTSDARPRDCAPIAPRTGSSVRRPARPASPGCRPAMSRAARRPS